MADHLEETSILAVEAHADDSDVNFSGTAVRFSGDGATARFLSACNGRKAHRSASEADLAVRRAGEVPRCAVMLGVEQYEALGCSDCEHEMTVSGNQTGFN